MKRNSIDSSKKYLFKKAENLFKKLLTQSNSQNAELETVRLIHELEVQYNELELQNEELHKTNFETQKSVGKYKELYDFAPACYFTLSPLGEIIELNLSAAKLLGKPRSKLIKKRLALFISDDTKEIFNQFIDGIFSNNNKQICDVILLLENKSQASISLTGIASQTNNHCLISAVNFTERKPLIEFNQLLLSSLPYPAMYVRHTDRVVISANKLALDFGAKVGDFCWNSFGSCKSNLGHKSDVKCIHPYLISKGNLRMCSFCQGDACMVSTPCQNNPNLEAFDRTWDAYWIKVSDSVYLHYLIDVTESRKLEISLKESELFLKKTQQIASLGTYIKDFTTGHWKSSEILDSIFGIDHDANKNVDLWMSIIHPKWNNEIMNLSLNDAIEKKSRFDKEYKIIRQNDKVERWVHEIGEFEFDEFGKPIKMVGTVHDITDRKHADEEKNFLLAAINNSDNRIVVKDLDLKIVAANKAWLKSKGESTIDNLLGKTDAEAFRIPADQEPVRLYMQEDRKAQQLSPGEFILNELPIKLFSGEDTLSMVKRFPIFDENGNLYCTGVIASDITERKRNEVALRENEHFLKKTQQIAKLGTYCLDISTGDWTGSEILGSILGINYDGKKNVEVWLKLLDPQIKSILLHYFFDEVLVNKSKFDREFEILRPDNGQVRWIHGVGDLILDENGNPAKMIGTIHDITDRKNEQIRIIRNLEFTEALLKSLPTPVFFKDANGVYIGCNASFTRQMGITSDQIKGKIAQQLWPNEQADIFHSKDLELIATKGFQKYETKITDKNKQIRDVIFSKNVFYDENGEVAGIVGTYVDITENKKNQDELQKSQQMLLTVLDNFPGVVFWKDIDSKYLGCNKAFALGAGLNSASEIIGKTDYELPWADKDATNYHEDDKEVVEIGMPKLHIIEKQHQNDGKVIWFDTCKIPLRDGEGKVVGVIGVANDITERKLVEENLLKSESKFRTLAEFTKDWEYWIDNDQNFIYCSPSCERITGYKASDFSKNPNLLDKIVYHDDQIVYLYHKQMQDVGIEVNEELQFRIVRKDGVVKWIGHVCKPMHDAMGTYIGVRVSNRDITKRKEIEQQLKISKRKYKLLSQNITDGIFISNKGKLEYINAGMNSLFGYGYREMEGLILQDMVLPNYKEKLESFIHLNSPVNKSLDIEVECLRKDGTVIFIEMYLNYIADENTVYGVAHDVTEKKQIQKRNMVKAIIQTEEAERAKFSKELHDGLGPLLSTIKIYLQWTQRLKSIKKRNEIILKAEEILEESLTTVKEISNRMSPHLLTNYGLSAAIQSFVNKIEETNVIKINFQSNAKRRIESDIEVALYRATIECINNTMKYAKAQNISVAINDSGKLIQLHYKDDGIGFDIAKTIAERNGLGLFNLKNRIETIGGKIQMFSEPGSGVDYQITIKLKSK